VRQVPVVIEDYVQIVKPVGLIRASARTIEHHRRNGDAEPVVDGCNELHDRERKRSIGFGRDDLQ
jgi:hypothetical protein